MTFKNGEKVYDTEYDEVFEFEENRDRAVVSQNPSRFRLATEADERDIGVLKGE